MAEKVAWKGAAGRHFISESLRVVASVFGLLVDALHASALLFGHFVSDDSEDHLLEVAQQLLSLR